MRIAAFDLSLTSTGVARHAEDEIHTDTLKSRLKGCERLVEVRESVLHEATFERADLVVLEGYAFGRPNQAHYIGELGGVVKVALLEAGLPVVVVPPASVKKYATESGAAKKEQVLGAAVHRAGREFATTDEADAFWLHQMACCHYGLAHVQMPAKNREALDAVEWPDLTEGATHGH